MDGIKYMQIIKKKPAKMAFLNFNLMLTEGIAKVT
jgi:hypothetical protein